VTQPAYETLRSVTPLASVVLAANPGPMTLTGTNTWLLRAVGSPDAVVVDPGPDDSVHLAAVAAAAGRVATILLTHGHPDHSAGARRLHELTGAPVRALDPAHRLGGEGLVEGDVVAAAGVEVRVWATPGHSSDSLSFLLDPCDATAAAVLTGAGGFFCSGADLVQMAPAATGLEVHEGRGLLREVVLAMQSCPLPVVAGVQGLCLAGGVGLVLGCDIVLASDGAAFGLPEVDLGLWPFMVSALLGRHVSPKRAMEMMLSGRRVPAAEALEMGLISRVVPHDELLRETLLDAIDDRQLSRTLVRLLEQTLCLRDPAGAAERARDVLAHEVEQLDVLVAVALAGLIRLQDHDPYRGGVDLERHADPVGSEHAQEHDLA